MDKKNKKHILRWLAASMCAFTVTSLTGCAEEVSNLFGGNRGEVEVTASFNEPGKAVTRAHDGLNGSGFTLTTEDNSESKVRVMVDKNDGDYSQFDYNVTGATTINRDSKPTFPSGESSVNVYGWYPARSLTNFTVAADQTGNNGYCLSDLLFANGTTCERNLATGAITQAANLAFNHVMAKVKVNLTLATGVTVKSATFKTMKNKVTVSETKTGNAVTGYTATTDGVSTSDITLLTGGSLTNASAADDLKLCGVFPDQEKNGAFLEIVASYNGGSDQTITYSFDVAKHFVKGNEYTMNISLDGTNVTTGTVTLTGWNVESGVVNIGGGGGGTLTLDNTSLNLTYGGSNGTVNVTEDGVSSCTATSASAGIATASASGTAVTITPVAAGSTQVLVYAVKDGNMLSSVVNVTVAKGTPTVTAPAYVGSTLTYNSSAQTLITAGSSSEGTTMKYALGTSSAAGETWSTDLPTGINAGTYYVWYKVEGGTNYNDVAAAMINGSKAIGKATPTLTLSTSSLTFTALNSEKTFTITYDGDGTLSASSNSTANATASLSNKTVTVSSVAWGSATITVSAAAGTNYNAATSQTVSVEVISDPGVALASATVGMIVGSNGKAYDVSYKDNLPSGVTAVAVVGYKNGTSGYAVALVNAAQDTWNNITNSGVNKDVDCTLSESKRGSVPAAPTGTTWKVLNEAHYKAMWQAMGSADTYNATSNKLITDAGGTALSGNYWSTKVGAVYTYDSFSWYFDSSGWHDNNRKNSYNVRPVLAW